MAEHIDLVDKHGVVQTKDVPRGYYNQNRALYPGEYMQIVLVLGVNALGHLLVHERSQHKKVDAGKIDRYARRSKPANPLWRLRCAA